MALKAGTRLGPYEITALIGAGGMGEVYRATDTRLDRTVAVKVLPEHLADDPQRRERFEREARAVSSLNHPNICTLHDVGEQDGIHYLVMEYVEGDTLQQRFKKGRLPLDQALEYAIQIADALDKAHRQGVVHRDLKPGNIMITKSAGVKLLDFGLAKLKARSAPLDQWSTIEEKEPLTAEGEILGTLQYMAPEQLEGKEADARTDIFAFGAVVYEMVTGKKAFEGASQASLIGAIMHSDPRPMSELQTLAPPSLDRLVRQSLAKDPDDRWQTAGDVMREVRWIAQPVLDGAVVPEASDVRSNRGRERVAWAVAATATLIALFVYLPDFDQTPTPGPGPSLELTILPPDGSSFRTVGGLAATPLISPDGSSVLFRSQGGLWVRRLDSIEPLLLVGTQASVFNSSFWSPDSQYVAFTSGGQLMKVRVPDGAPESIAETTGIQRGGTWSHNGTILLSHVEDLGGFKLVATQDSGGELQPVEVPGLEEGEFFHPQFLPDGENFIFLHLPWDSEEEGDIHLATLQDGRATNPVRLLRTTTAARYTPAGGGRLLFIRNDNLYAQALDSNLRRLEGDAELVEENVASMPGIQSFSAYFSVSHSGTLAWRPGRAPLGQVTVFDREGNEIETAGPEGTVASIALSPDGTRLLADGEWLLRPNQPGRNPLGAGYWSIWSPDGSGLLGSASLDDLSFPLKILERPVDGSAVPRELGPAIDGWPQDVSPDGTEILYTGVGGRSVYTARVGGPPGDGTDRLLVQTGERVYGPRFSPAGRWIVYQVVGDDGTNVIYVQPFPGGVEDRQLIAYNGFDPQWRGDGREIAYLGLEDGIWSVWSVRVDAVRETLNFGAPEPLFSVRPPAYLIRPDQPLAVSHDGFRFYFVQGSVEQPGSGVIHVKVGWPWD